MTEEIPLEDPSEYKFPDGYFERLQKYSTNGSKYSIVQGQFYETMRNDKRFKQEEMLDITRCLNNGEVDNAIQKTKQLLEQ